MCVTVSCAYFCVLLVIGVGVWSVGIPIDYVV